MFAYRCWSEIYSIDENLLANPASFAGCIARPPHEPLIILSWTPGLAGHPLDPTQLWHGMTAGRSDGNRINYALLHSRGRKVATNVAIPTLDITMEKMLSRAVEASRLTDDASCEVKRLLDLSDEDLEQALQEAQDEIASLQRRKKAQELMEIRRQNADQRQSVEATELPAASVKRQASTPQIQSDSEQRLFDVDFHVQPSLKDLEFLDQEVEWVVHRQVSTWYDPEHVRRPETEEIWHSVR